MSSDFIKEADQILDRCENELRAVLSAAAEDGDYDAVDVLSRQARALRSVISRDRETPLSAHKARSSSTSRGKKREYPRFVKNGDQLVKIGWSKKAKDEYEHRVPRWVADILFGKVAPLAGSGKVWTTEDFFPITNAETGQDAPDYQSYAALAWLRAIGVVEKVGRSGYRSHLYDSTLDFKRLWQNLNPS